MSRMVSGIASSWASISVRSPNRPARLADPPAKVKRVGASRQPSAARVRSAGLVSSNGRRSSVPLPLTDIDRAPRRPSVECEIAPSRSGHPGTDLADAAA